MADDQTAAQSAPGTPVQAREESHAEALKRSSSGLRGTIADTLKDMQADKFTEDEYSLLKFHGIYQQYDRDTATQRKKQGLEKEYSLMTRLRIPAGRLTAQQYLGLDQVADLAANSTLRITTRQTFQFHGTLKGDAKALMRAIHTQALTTMAACGDVVRNVTAPSAPVRSAKYATLNRVADEISTHFLPQTGAWAEIWLDGEKQPDPPGPDPVYGETYLPRKFKIGLAIPEDNTTDVLTNDVGIIGWFEGDEVRRWTVAVGGGLGMKHNKPATYPRLATPLFDVEPDGLIGLVEAIVKTQRDWGDRQNRQHARLKYTLDDMGEDAFRAEVEKHAGRSFEPASALPELQMPDVLGWHAQGDGKYWIGVPVSSGRILDTETMRLRTALREIAVRFEPEITLTPQQDILLGDIADSDCEAVTAILRDNGVILREDLSEFSRWALACPAMPTCGLALSEAERVRDPIVTALEERLAAHGLGEERISLRITGCPNGCARPYAGDIGLVGRMPGAYALYVGGDFEGTRLSFKLLDKLKEGDIADTLDPLFAAFAAQAKGGEGFGDFCTRLGQERLTQLIDDAQEAAQ